MVKYDLRPTGLIQNDETCLKDNSIDRSRTSSSSRSRTSRDFGNSNNKKVTEELNKLNKLEQEVKEVLEQYKTKDSKKCEKENLKTIDNSSKKTDSSPLLKCDFCSKTFRLRQYHTRHLKKSHSANTDGLKTKEMSCFKCDICFKTFRIQQCLNEHLKRCQKKKQLEKDSLKSDICSKTFRLKRYKTRNLEKSRKEKKVKSKSEEIVKTVRSCKQRKLENKLRGNKKSDNLGDNFCLGEVCLITLIFTSFILKS